MASDHQIGDAPIEERWRETMNAVAHGLDDVFNGDERPKKVGFVLLVFPFGDDSGRCNYISNSDRADIRVLLKEQLARFEGMPEATGRG